MDIQDAVKILKQHNEWRRGNTENDEMIVSAKTIGIAIDTMIEHFENNSVLDDVIKCVDCNDKQMTREADGGILICHCFDKD